MSYFIATCDCGVEADMRIDKAPREKLCKCGKWVPFIEKSNKADEEKDSD